MSGLATVFGKVESFERDCVFPPGGLSMPQGVLVFVNYEQARAYSDYTADMVFAILGAVTRSDGGEGMWYYNADSVLADNGGTVLLPSNVDPGRLIRIT